MQIEIPSNPEIITFNLGGGYSEKGQPCAAAKISDSLVYFVDAARGLDYFYECELSVDAIRFRYLHNRHVYARPSCGVALGELRLRLENAANA